MKNSQIPLIGAAAVALSVISFPGVARANTELELMSGTNIVTVGPNSSGESQFNGSIGAWSVNVTTGLAAPNLGANTLNLSSIDSTTSPNAAPLTILFSSTGNAAEGYTTTAGGTETPGMSATFSSYAGTSLLGVNSLLTAALPFSSSAFNGGNSGTLFSGPTNLTEEVVIYAAGDSDGGSQISFSDNLAGVPSGVPDSASTIALMAAGSASLFAFGRFAKSKKS